MHRLGNLAKGAAAVALAVVAAGAAPGNALAETATRTFALDEAVPVSIEQDGVEFALSSWEQKPSGAPETRRFVEEDTLSVPASEFNGDARSYFDPSRAVDEDGFSGTIPLESATAAPVTEREQHGVTRADEFSNLTAAEVAALPATRPHQIGDVVVTLSLASVDADPVIIPSIVPRYSGTARYSGSYETETVASYTLTARYAGDLEKEGAAGSLVAVYESIEAPAAEPAEPAKEPAAQPSEGDDRSPAAESWPVAATMLAAAGAAALGAVAFGRRRRPRPGLPKPPEKARPVIDVEPAEDADGRAAPPAAEEGLQTR